MPMIDMSHGFQAPFVSGFFSPFASTTGIGIGPPGESGNLAVNTSTPSAVTRSVCSVEALVYVLSTYL
jgi:hypothetical protein